MLEFDFKEKIEAEEARLAAKNAKLRKSFYILGFLVAAIIIFSSAVMMAGDSSEVVLSKLPLLGRLLGLSPDKQLIGEDQDRINILLLGMGGKGHDGAYLTDTMILASIQPSTKKISLISIPRDLVVPYGSGPWQKINSINAYAEQKGEDGGAATAQAVSELFEIPIPYYVRADFDGFVNIIDELGGVTIDVDNTLDDYAYPIDGQEDNPNYYARYEHLHIDKGIQTMNGTLALKYARSRHGINGEGSDFARSKRQKKILAAVKNGLLDKGNLLRPGMLTRILGQLQQHISTNVSIWEGMKLWTIAKEISDSNLISKGFDDGPTNFLVAARGTNGAFILVPKTGNFNAMKSFVQGIFGSTTVATLTTSPNINSIPGVQTSSPAIATVQVKNGTMINGLASKAATSLRSADFNVIKVGNASERDFASSTIYDLTYGEKDSALDTLKAKTGAEVVVGLPDWLIAEIKGEIAADPSEKQPDFILLLGSGQASNKTSVPISTSSSVEIQN